MRATRSMEIRAGLFVFGVMALFTVTVFILGSESHTFDEKFVVEAVFDNVAGLRQGAEVQLAGLPAGLVTNVGFSDDLSDQRVYVEMELITEFQPRIREDSIVTIANMGVLGDKYLEISVGSDQRDQPVELLPEPLRWRWLRERYQGGLTLPSDVALSARAVAAWGGVQSAGGNANDLHWVKFRQELNSTQSNRVSAALLRELLGPAADGPFELAALETGARVESGLGLLDGLMAQGGDIVGQVTEIAGSLADMLGDEGEERESLASILSGIDELLVKVNEGQGALGMLVADSETREALSSALGSLEGASRNLNGVLAEVRSGDGGLHQLIYGQQLSELADRLNSAVSGIDEVVTEIKEGDGQIHELVYDNGDDSLLAQLNGAAQDISAITTMVRDGEGTLGALVVDPTLYEEVRTLFGGARRNALLRGVVRGALRSAERSEGVEE